MSGILRSQASIPRRSAGRRRLARWLSPALAVLLLSGWQLVAWRRVYASFILPSPLSVWRRFLSVMADGSLPTHTLVTLSEVLGGLLLGLTVALTLGYLLAKSPALEELLLPYLVASQALPIVALAPLLVIWLGAGTLSKVVVCALTLFFPVLVNTVVGIRSVEPGLRDLMRSLEAGRLQTLWHLEIPAALPVLLSGLKIGLALSVIGAVVGEFVAADRGLGFLVNLARGLFDTPLMFVALFTLMGIALVFYAGMSLLEQALLRWQRESG